MKRLLEVGDPATRRLLASASADRPSPAAARATLVTLGLAAPAVAASAAAAPVAAASKGLFSSLTGKLVVAMAAATVASGTVLAVAPARHAAPAPALPREAPVVRASAAAVVQPSISPLAAEGALLRRAADALVARDARGALEALDEHDATFAQPQLAEEALALRVEALAARGDLAAANAALKTFQAQFPDSPFVPVIKPPTRGDGSPQAMDGRARQGDTR